LLRGKEKEISVCEEKGEDLVCPLIRREGKRKKPI